MITVCALLLLSGLVREATAHPEFSAVTTNRFLKLDLIAADEVRLAYTVMYGAAPAYAERKRADTNADGRLDDAETRALGERLRAEVIARLKLSVDGQPVVPAFEPASVGLAGAEVGPSPFSVDLVARIHCPPSGSGHTLVLDDQTELPQLGETEIRVEESPQTRLLESHRGSTSTGSTGSPGATGATTGSGGPRESRILFRGPRFSALEDRSVTIRFESNGRSHDQPSGAGSRSRVALVAVTALSALGVLLWVVLRRRKRARPASP